MASNRNQGEVQKLCEDTPMANALTAPKVYGEKYQ